MGGSDMRGDALRLRVAGLFENQQSCRPRAIGKVIGHRDAQCKLRCLPCKSGVSRCLCCGAERENRGSRRRRLRVAGGPAEHSHGAQAVVDRKSAVPPRQGDTKELETIVPPAFVIRRILRHAADSPDSIALAISFLAALSTSKLASVAASRGRDTSAATSAQGGTSATSVCCLYLKT